MNIVMFSINPLFPDKVMGGAPKHLQNIAVHLGELGHQVTVLCTHAAQQPFKWHPNVAVQPVLRFHQPFPQPYAVPAYDMAAAIQDVADYLVRADRFYMHDGEFLFPYVYRHVPTVISLRDNVYPETLIGGFLFQGAKLVLISEFSRQYFRHTVGRFFPGLDSRIEVIHNGLDWDKFQYTPPQKILDYVPVDPDAGPILLHPHRPEESKGIRQTIAVADKLVHEYNITDLKILAPQWLESQLTPDLGEFYDSIMAEIETRGLKAHFVFHGWVPQALMPEYYSLGAVTLSLGHFVESFGNAVYESLGCGTPSIAARIATHRELLPDDLIDKVDYGDIDGAAAIAARIIRDEERTRTETMAYLHQHYGIQRQLDTYARVILNAEVADELIYQHRPLDENTRFRLAPWCYRAERGVYHDFHANYRDLSALFDRASFTHADAAQAGIGAGEVEALYREGYLVPLIGD